MIVLYFHCVSTPDEETRRRRNLSTCYFQIFISNKSNQFATHYTKMSSRDRPNAKSLPDIWYDEPVTYKTKTSLPLPEMGTGFSNNNRTLTNVW